MAFGRFKQGFTSTNDVERSRMPKDVTTPDIIEEILNNSSDDPNVEVHKLAEAASISFGSLAKIGMRI